MPCIAFALCYHHVDPLPSPATSQSSPATARGICNGGDDPKLAALNFSTKKHLQLQHKAQRKRDSVFVHIFNRQFCTPWTVVPQSSQLEGD